MVLLKKLLNSLTFHSPAILSSEEGEKYPKEFEILSSLGVLKQDTFPQERWCPSCESESLPIQTVSKERAYTLCTMDEEATRDYFDPQTLKQWLFTTPPFITLFLKTLGIDQPSFTETITGLLWNLGTHEINGNQYHLFFTRNIAEIGKDKRSIITSTTNTAVFYLGAVHGTLPDDILFVPVLDIVKDLNSEGLVIDHKTLNSYLSDTTPSQKHDQLLKCGKLQVNLSQGVIQYSGNNPVEIEPDNEIIKFLVVLMESKKVVEYVEIAKRLETNYWHEGVINKDVAREVQFLRRDLATFLRDKVGMTNKEIQKVIINKKNIGYKLHCETTSLKTH